MLCLQIFITLKELVHFLKKLIADDIADKKSLNHSLVLYRLRYRYLPLAILRFKNPDSFKPAKKFHFSENILF